MLKKTQSKPVICETKLMQHLYKLSTAKLK